MRTLLTALLISILTACTPSLIPAPSPTQIIFAKPSPENIIPTKGVAPNMDPVPSTPVTPNLQSLTEKAKEDLAHRLSIEKSQILVVEARDVFWSNSSLGCPQPGMLYAEVLSPGYLILLNVYGEDYEYHAGKNSDAFYCENPTPPISDMSGDT